MIYHFGHCTFDPDRGTLRYEGALIHTEPQALIVLGYLLAHRDRVVSREELFAQCWPESYVTDSSLTSCLSRIRHAIGQARDGPTFIQTWHRRGYQFVGEVRDGAPPGADERAALASRCAVALRGRADPYRAPSPPRAGLLACASRSSRLP